MEVTIGKHNYRTGRLSAFQQLHIARRLTPCLGKLATLSGADVALVRDEAGNVKDFSGDFSVVIGPVTEAVTALTDADVEYICNACLDVVERKQSGGGWAPVRGNGTTMYELHLAEILQLASVVVREHLSDFFSDLPSGSPLEGLKSLARV